MNNERLTKLAAWAHTQAVDVIFPFWTSDYIVDKENGGFFGRVTLEMERLNDEPRGLTLTGRMLYAFSPAYRVLKNPLYLEKAEYTYNELMHRFYDPEFGGAYTTVTETGEVLNDNKPNYCEAFLIMGCSAYYRASGCEEALRVARECAAHMENEAKWGPSRYYNNMTRDWKKAEGMGFGGKKPKDGEEAPKRPAFFFPEGSVMFPHHLCQAYVQLYRAAGDENILQALREMAEYVVSDLYDETYHCFKTIVGPDGERVGTRQSFGHDCEISYLAMKVADIVGDETLKANMKRVVTSVLERVLEADFDPWHSLYNGGDLVSGEREKSHIWWAQAEAVTAMLLGYQLTGEDRFLDACEKQVDFLDKYFVNREHGDWYNNIVVDEDGWKVVDGMHGFDKLNGGKCPFHNSQMCFEIMERTQKMLCPEAKPEVLT